MRKAKKTTLDERLKIVTDCLANDKNYGAMALKYGCSYQQVRNWVKRYEKMGQAGLEDRRGRRIASLPSRTPEEELRDKIAELERRMEKQKSGAGIAYGIVSRIVCILEWGRSNRRIADSVRICSFFGWKTGLSDHGRSDDFLFISPDKNIYFWKCDESADLSGISGGR